MGDFDEYTYQLRVKDLSESIWTLNVPKIKFTSGYLLENDVYLIKACQRDSMTTKFVLQCKPTTNIVRFPEESKIYKDFARLVQLTE